MAKNILSELHQILLNLDYRYLRANQLPRNSPNLQFGYSKGIYVKTFTTSCGDFKIALDIAKDPYLSLPQASILESPKKYEGRLLPHVGFGYYLCYVDQMEADWDSNDLVSTYFSVDSQIQRTLQTIAISNTSVMDQEFEGEFTAYWRPEFTVYLLSDVTQPKTLTCSIVKNDDSAGWIIHHEDDEAVYTNWLLQKKYTNIITEKCNSGYFRVFPKQLSGYQWPPENFKSFINWLSETDHHTKAKLVKYFTEHPHKRHFLNFDIVGYGFIALFIEIDINRASLNSYSGSHRKTKKNPRKLKQPNLVSLLSNKDVVQKFIRLRVIKLTKSALLSRNRPRPEVGDLRDKKIALIGCGSVGGYLAPLLLRSGAGCGQGCFHLYDHDSFHPDNYGRHQLGSADFLSNKAEATAKMLKNSVHFDMNVESFDTTFPITEKDLRSYDIILDATGRPPVSRRLARVVRNIDFESRPVMIHGFNDGYGRSSKVFIDNGVSCFGCLISDVSFYKDGIDLRFKELHRIKEQRTSCGATYTPYDAAVSVITASMMQEATLNTLESSLSWTYKEHMFDGSRSRKPRFVSLNPNCEVCDVPDRAYL